MMLASVITYSVPHQLISYRELDSDTVTDFSLLMESYYTSMVKIGI